MTKRLTKAAAAVAMLLPMMSCLDPTGGLDCSNHPALHVYVRDAVTLDYKAAGATVSWTTGSTTQSETVPPIAEYDSLAVGAAFVRPGTYSITVTRNGYQAWTRNGIAVSADCWLPAQVHEARLQPLSAATASATRAATGAVPLPGGE